MNLSRAINLASRWMQGYVVTLRDGEAREYHKLCHEALKRMREQESAKNAHYNCCKNGNSSWISVEDRLPEEDGKYIVCTSKNAVYCARFYERSTALHPNGSFGTDSRTHVTHWMPMPKPPEVEG